MKSGIIPTGSMPAFFINMIKMLLPIEIYCYFCSVLQRIEVSFYGLIIIMGLRTVVTVCPRSLGPFNIYYITTTA